MTRTFIETTVFTRQCQALGLTEDDLEELQRQIMENPQVGKVIQGTGGIRKMRFTLPGKGKRGGSRVCYVDFVLYETVYLMTTYGKGEKTDLTETEKQNLKAVVSEIEKQLRNNERRPGK